MDTSPWEFGWSALSAIGTLAATGAAVWLGWSSRKYTNQLMEAEQRRQASLIRVAVPELDLASWVPGQELATFHITNLTVTNGSQEGITDLWIHAKVVVADAKVGSDEASGRKVIGMPYLPAGISHTSQCTVSVTAGAERYATRLTVTFTDARDVRWKLDENYKLQRTHAGDGIPTVPHEVVAWNEDNPVVAVMPPPPVLDSDE
jgi:hypothetical protein